MLHADVCWCMLPMLTYATYGDLSFTRCVKERVKGVLEEEKDLWCS
jgi:hypothetical protein